MFTNSFCVEYSRHLTIKKSRDLRFFMKPSHNALEHEAFDELVPPCSRVLKVLVCSLPTPHPYLTNLQILFSFGYNFRLWFFFSALANRRTPVLHLCSTLLLSLKDLRLFLFLSYLQNPILFSIPHLTPYINETHSCFHMYWPIAQN